MAQITGTASDEYIYGSYDRDVIDARGGNDFISAFDGDDTIYGGSGNDIIYGMAGADVMYGGGGDDEFVMTDEGDDVAFGQAGNDLFVVTYGYSGTARVGGGTGNDTVYFEGGNRLVANMGDGNDVVSFLSLPTGGARLTLGAGRDLVYFESVYQSSGVLVITDFETGNTGDVFSMDWLDPYWYGYDSDNPFTAGILKLVQVGDDTVLRLDGDGPGGELGFQTIAIFQNTDATAFTTTNFDGIPPDGSPVPGVTLIGTAGNDGLFGTNFSDTLEGRGGSDRLYGFAGNDLLNGGAGSDFISVGAGNDTAIGGGGNDEIYSQENGDDILYGGAGNDRFYIYRYGTSQSDADTIRAVGGEGDDYFAISLDADSAGHLVRASGGDGEDVFAIGDLHGRVVLALGAGSDSIWLTSIDIEPDLVVVSDFQAGADGDNILVTNALSNWNGDNPFATGHVRLVQQGNDTLVQIDGNGGGDNFQTAVRLKGVVASELTADNFDAFPLDGSPIPGETFIGSDGDDQLVGTFGGDHIEGLGGNDRLFGGYGQDLIEGGDGDDFLVDGPGSDKVFGGAGNDILYSRTVGNDLLNGGAGNDQFDVLRYGNAEDIVRIIGAGGDDYAILGGGNSTTVIADMGSGADRVLLAGGATGDLTITLGSGNDTIELSWLAGTADSVPVVTDFQTGDDGDRIDWGTLFDAFQDFEDDLNPFRSGYLRLVQDGDDTLVQVNRGNGFVTALVLQDTIVGAFTSVNLGGYEYDTTPYPGERIVGTESSEDLYGTDGNDIILGLGGDDWIYGDRGDDRIEGGQGNDYILGGSGTDTVSYRDATNGVQVLLQYGSANGWGYDYIYDVENVDGSDYNDFLMGAENANVLRGFAGNDYILGLGGDDTLIGQTGNDYLSGGEGVDVLNGGSGFDLALYSDDYATQGVVVDLRDGSVANDGYGNMETLISIEGAAVNTQFVDTVYGNDMHNLFAVGAQDIVYAFGGDDDVYVSGAPAVLDGGEGVDTLLADTSDLVAGSEGQYWADYVPREAGVTIDLAMGMILADGFGGNGSFTGFENVTGSELGDLIRGDAGANELSGLGGGDTLIGRAGDDTLMGGEGNDMLLGGLGDDMLDGGEGVDAASYRFANSGVTVSLALQGEAQDTGEGMDTLVGIERLFGSAFEDLLSGSTGNDRLYGLDRSDRLNGGSGADLLSGGAGQDVLFGGGGHDRLIGGGGSDRFNFADGHLGERPGQTDTIVDFRQVQGDMIRLTGIDADTTVAGDQAFTFIGEAAFTSTAGEMRYYQNDGHTYLEMDTNGDGMADMYLHLKGNIDLTNDDFFL